MGRAIEQDGRLDGHDVKLEEHDKRIKLMEDALEEMIQTKVHHIDLHNEMDNHEERIRKENNVVEPDEEFTPPAGKRKRTTKTKTATVG